jgi:hypothetical protein
LSGHFEAKKIAWRQTKDGLVLALAVHPDEMPKEMALSPLNTRYMIGFAEIGDDEKPKETGSEVGRHAGQHEDSGCAVVPATSSSEPASGSHKRWSEMARSQQAFLLCRDCDFWIYWGAVDQIHAEKKLKQHFRIDSKRDLDKPENHGRWDEFVALYHLHRDRLR